MSNIELELFPEKIVLYPLSTFGKKSFEQHYRGHSVEDVEVFIQNVVVKEDDPMRVQREHFYEEYLKPKDGILPSQKILDTIEQFISGNIS